MKGLRLPSTAAAPKSSARIRIAKEARGLLFGRGYSRFTMAELAGELGMSKKTLYVHFSDKHSLALEVVEGVGAEVRAGAEEILADRGLSFAGKLHRFLGLLTERLARLDPSALRDLQRFAPDVYRRIEELRAAALPDVFGRLLDQGRAQGMVDRKLDLALAVDYHLHAVQGLMRPDSLIRLRISPGEVCERAVRLLMSGLLTAAGRKEYENADPRR